MRRASTICWSNRACDRRRTRAHQLWTLSTGSRPNQRARLVWIGFWSRAFTRLYGLEGIGGADALQIPLYEELVSAGGIVRLGSWFTTVAPAGIAAGCAAPRHAERSAR